MQNIPITEQKKSLRRQLLAKRNAIPQEQIRKISREICLRLATFEPVINSATVAAFWPLENEPDLIPFLTELANSGKQITLPIIKPERQMEFGRWNPQDVLRQNNFGIFEPLEYSPRVLPEQMECMLIPALAGNRDCLRLGYGGGYYDRLLQKIRASNLQLKAIGIMPDEFIVDELPVDEHDQPLDFILTEKSILER